MNEIVSYLKRRLLLLGSLIAMPAIAVAWTLVAEALNRPYGFMRHRVPTVVLALYVVGVVFSPLTGLFTLLELARNRERLVNGVTQAEMGPRDTVVVCSVIALLIDGLWLAFAGYLRGLC